MHGRVNLRRFRSRLAPVAWRECQRQSHSAAWLELLISYTQRSQVHGLNQVFIPTMRRRMRLLWSLALISAIISLIVVCYLLAERYQRKSFKTVIASAHAPVSRISFPVLIVCNKNRLNWSRVPEITKRYNISARQRPLFERILTAYDALSFARFDVFDGLEQQPLWTLNHLNFTKIAAELAWRCDELLQDCVWQTQKRSCCDLFKPRRLQQGMCLAFNERSRRRSSGAGRGSGLIVKLQLQQAKHAPGNYRPKGFVLNIIEPFVWYGFPIEVSPLTRTNIAISPVYQYYDSSTRALSSQRRRCVFEYEYDSDDFKTLKGRRYMLENCQSECQQQYLLRYCNCTLDLFYPPSDYKACKLEDLPCLAKHNYLLQRYEQEGEKPFLNTVAPGLICDCLYSCRSLTLETELHKAVMRPWEFFYPLNPNESRSVYLNVFFKMDSMVVYRTSLIYTWLDLLASFGGICQLFLGCSIISLIELAYFGLINVPQFCWRRYLQRCLN